ncbi:PE-PGRS family protein PE_PGRS16-like isoform X4 [Anopheles darlingi]|uniref:PE-PGRS family protein PE_PGRS16-like isoform X4 n=1 Tax=Anopheles darlingi TaxID=43151 RepID=UPI0021005542|nr:PE-PGRS family protein PE_PGRS16-like isoform X4 [Anopheles darlingi]
MLLRVGVVVLGLCLTLVRAADDVIECTTDDDKKGECVKLHLCRNGVINDDGANIIDIRFNPDNVCEDYLLKCCAIPEDEDDQVLVPPSSSLPQQPVTGNQVGPTAGSNPGVTGLNAGGATNVPGTPGPIAPSPTPDVLDLASGKPKPSSGVGGGAGVGSCNCKGSGKCCGPHLEDEQLTLIGGDLYSGGGKPNSENLIKENNPQQPVHGGGPPIDSPRPNPSGGQGQGPIGAGGQPGAGGAGGQTAVKPGQGPIGTGGQPGAGGAGPAGGQSAVKPGQGPIGTGGQPGAGGAGGQSAVGQGQGPIGTGGQPGAGGAGGQSAVGQGQGQGPIGAGGQPGAGGAGPAGGQSAVKPGQGPIGAGGQPGAGGAGPSGGQIAVKPGQGPIGAGGQPGAGGAGGQSAVGQGQGPIGTGGQPGAGGAGPSGGQSAVKPGQGPIGAGGQPGAGGAGGQSAGGQGQGPLGAGSQPGAGGAGPSVGQSTVKPGQGTGQGQPSAGGAGSSGGQNAANPGAGGAKPSPAGIKGSGGGSKDRTGQGTTQSPFASTVQPQKCGLRNVDGVGFRITGDKDGESEYGEFPWMVAILKQEKALDQIIHVYQCGGSLIHPSVVLTAAHCVLDKNPQDITLRLGEWDTQTKNEMFDYQDRKAVEIVTHAEFYKGGLFNDVALVFLDKPAELMETVNTICLPPPDFNFDASRCFASGWGKDVFGKQGTYQVILKKIELPVMPRAQCQTALRTTRLGRRFKLHGSFICAGGEKGRDTCKGDGGSPLVCPIPGSVNHYYQAGMVAWGIGCGEDGIPGVYVNVPLFRGWIDQHLTQRNISHSSFLYA